MPLLLGAALLLLRILVMVWVFLRGVFALIFSVLAFMKVWQLRADGNEYTLALIIGIFAAYLSALDFGKYFMRRKVA